MHSHIFPQAHFGRWPHLVSSFLWLIVLACKSLLTAIWFSAQRIVEDFLKMEWVWVFGNWAEGEKRIHRHPVEQPKQNHYCYHPWSPCSAYE